MAKLTNNPSELRKELRELHRASENLKPDTIEYRKVQQRIRVRQAKLDKRRQARNANPDNRPLSNPMLGAERTGTAMSIPGTLEIDHGRGVIYFHSSKTGQTVLRICQLPVPIPDDRGLDITHMFGADWDGTPQRRKEAVEPREMSPVLGFGEGSPKKFVSKARLFRSGGYDPDNPADALRTGKAEDAAGDEFDQA